MSELRDQVSVFAAISKSLSSIEKHIANIDASAEQLRVNIHDLRNQLAISQSEREESEQAIASVRLFMVAFDRELKKIQEMIVNLQTIRLDDIRALSRRLAKVEEKDEVTKS